MPIVLKTRDEIAIMRVAGRIVDDALQKLVSRLRPGLVEKELDELVRAEFRRRKVIPAFLDYHGYPATVCVSINDEIVHGIPGDREIKDGDIVSMDLGCIYKGFVAAIQSYVEGEGFSVVREYVGHGVGRQMHEDPQVPNYGSSDSGPMIREGMVIAIEPMVNAGDWHTKRDSDNWTVRALEGSLSAHFEHTIAVRDGEAEGLTLP